MNKPKDSIVSSRVQIKHQDDKSCQKNDINVKQMKNDDDSSTKKRAITFVSVAEMAYNCKISNKNIKLNFSNDLHKLNSHTHSVD